eukprot:TRINITY_DN81965_c0_g1_i1.p1 TRINITY_DN81965_c0_g1~~TRINITY_DN81965_c0_g1_i1.p1  ORF type:complete len:204 (+),score=42.10 TRINITY_DN81965_c0_g1_i1:67-678(+)
MAAQLGQPERLRRIAIVFAACGTLQSLCFSADLSILRSSSAATLRIPSRSSSSRVTMLAEDWQEERWWETPEENIQNRLQVEEATDAIARLRRQMSLEEQAFDQEIEDVVVAGKRALLRLRMQKAVEMPGMKTHLFKKIRKQIARALTLRRQREIARGITSEQSRRMKRRKKLELKVAYEDAYGREAPGPKSKRWLRRMGKII